MNVFDGGPRQDDRPARHGESAAAFYARVAGGYWDEVRACIEDWFSRLPSDAKADVRSRLRSDDNRQFSSAYFELYLHEVLLCSGFRVTCHPDVPGTSRRPDFLAEDGEASFYVEARVVSGSDAGERASRRLARLYDSLDAMDLPNFFLNVEVFAQGPKDPPTKPLRAAITSWLDSLAPDAVSAGIGDRGFMGLPVKEWACDGWRLVFRPIPKKPEARGPGRGMRALGAYGPGNASWVDDATPLRAALSDKGKAYGVLDKPFLVAVNTSRLTDDDVDVMNALYGTEAIQLGTTSAGELVTRSVRAPDGYWFAGRDWLHRGVSAVLVARQLSPVTPTRSTPTMWAHPDPVHAAPRLPICRHVSVRMDELRVEDPAASPAELLGLPTPWPTAEAFPKFA